MRHRSSRLFALAESLLVTLIWASSFVFVKKGLDYFGPLTIAGLRYFLGALVLLPFILCNGISYRALPRATWLRLAAIGISAYTLGNGAMFWGLKFLPATTVSFLMSLTPLLILPLSIVWLKETPARAQIAGAVVTLAGSALFFSPGLRWGETLGLAILSIALISFAFFSILGQEAARARKVGTLSLTAIPLAIGGGLLLLIAFPLEGLPSSNATGWGIVLWLAVINTALGYVLYNHALKTLTAFEMNIVFNLTPLGTALFAWLLLGERLIGWQWAGMITVIAGVMLVQRASRPQSSAAINNSRYD